MALEGISLGPRSVTLSGSQSKSTPGSSPPLAHLLPTPQPAPHFLCAVSQYEGTSHAVDCKRIVRNLWAWEKRSTERDLSAALWVLAGVVESLWYFAVAVALKEG